MDYFNYRILTINKILQDDSKFFKVFSEKSQPYYTDDLDDLLDYLEIILNDEV